MRSLIFAALILAPAALAAQDIPVPGTDVERIGLQPGESASSASRCSIIAAQIRSSNVPAKLPRR